MTVKDLSISDFQRLSMEVGLRTENAAEWAEKIGLPIEIVEGIGEVGSRMVFSKLEAAAIEQSMEDGAFEDDEGPRELRGADIPFLIRQACVSAFVLGWEGCSQFGGRDVGE